MARKESVVAAFPPFFFHNPFKFKLKRKEQDKGAAEWLAAVCSALLCCAVQVAMSPFTSITVWSPKDYARKEHGEEVAKWH